MKIQNTSVIADDAVDMLFIYKHYKTSLHIRDEV
jgi:hypothetical protein